MATPGLHYEVKRGDVYYVRFDKSWGAEMSVGRPVVVVSADNIEKTLPMFSCVFMTTTNVSHSLTSVELTSTAKKSWALCNQLYSFDEGRLKEYKCTLNDREMAAIDKALGIALGLSLYDPDEDQRYLDEKNELISRHKAEMAALKESHAEELASVRAENSGKLVDFELHKRLYERALTELAELKFSRDLAAKEPVAVEEAAEEPAEDPVEEPAEELIDINRCSLSALKNIGFSIATANMIIAARPYLKIEDLKIVPGVTKIAYRIVEKKITVGDVSEFVKKPKRESKKPEPVEVKAEVKVEEPKKEEPVAGKVNVNTANGPQIAAAIGYNKTVGYLIAGYRTKNGPYKSLEELQNVPRLSKPQYKRCLEVLTV